MYIKFIFIVITSLISPFSSFSIKRESGETTAESQTVLDSGGNLILKWAVNYTTRRVLFRLILSEKAPTFNWLAIGFSDRGTLENADVCLLWTDYKDKGHFEDAHTDKDGKIHRDKLQHCDAFTLDPETRTITFERFFDTCDDDDYVIEDGTTHIVWARGNDLLFSSRGLCLPCTDAKNKGFVRVRVLTVPAVPQPKVQRLSITNKNLKVPGSDTTYWCKIFKLPEYITKKRHHIIQFESTITPGNEGLVHHMEVFYCDIDSKITMPMYEGSCFAADRPDVTKKCSKVKGAWAMGAPPFVYPEEAGLPLGGPTSNKYVMLEVHYNNPELKQDWIDSSGMTLHVTTNLRRYDAAIMELGLEYTDKMAIPGGQSAFPLTGYCIPQCTGVGLPSEGIVVFGSQLHTHLTGAAVWTRHVRGGVELPVLNKDLHYSTHFQEIRILHHPIKILPGDYLETTCLYDTHDKTNATIGGHAITDEMCVNYMHYYPATQLEVCKSSVSTTALNGYFEFESRWDLMPTSDKASPRQNYLAISPWTPLRTQALHKLYVESPISMQCNKSDGNRFQGDWENIPIPKIKLPLMKESRICPDFRK